MPEQADFDATRADFVVLFIADWERGAVRTEEEYRRRYPGHEHLISAEYRRLADALGPAPALEAGEPSRLAGPSEGARPAWTLGKYRIERELGRGAQGTVFLAVDTSLGRQVALKVLKASWSGSQAMVRRFEREAQALARLDHPGIATLHDFGSDHGLHYFAMRYVEGRTLAEELAAPRDQGPANRDEVQRFVTLMEKAARVVHAAHEAGLIHRDLKPANVMITPDGEPVILDFGLARLHEADATSLTVTGDIFGTPAFMAPEQLAAEHGRVDQRTDVFGLGAILHEAVTGAARRATGDAEGSGVPSLLRPKRPARTINPAVSRELDLVIQAALSPDLDGRYASAADFADDLARVRDGLPILVEAPGSARKFALWCRRAPWAAALVILVPLALASGMVFLSLKNREIEQSAKDLEVREQEADAAARLAQGRLVDFRRLDDLRAVQVLEERERDLWPPHPAMAAAMERWLVDARALLKRLPEHRAALAALRRRGRPLRDRPPFSDPAADAIRYLTPFRDVAEARLRAGVLTEARRKYLQNYLSDAAAMTSDLEKDLASRPVFVYDDVKDQSLEDNLGRLVQRLEALEGSWTVDRTIASVVRRLELARAIEDLTLVKPAAAWKAAIAAIANPETDPDYGGMRMVPILGLVPIGRDPRSHLWEFAHVLSGTPPARDAAGNLVITDESSIVLVLIPGGTFMMGARAPEEGEDWEQNVDPQARKLEGPVHAVSLDPFLISKFEMTQRQWRSTTGWNPSQANPDRHWDGSYRPTFRNPVEAASLRDCEETLWRLGLVLPTEAQWERAARGGTTTPWWAGQTTADFPNTENLADLTLKEAGGQPYDQERRDGWIGSAPVGSFAPNPFGLHDVIGNVSEWCGDRTDFYDAPVLPADGLRCRETLDLRVVRGGSFATPAALARSAYRYGIFAETRSGSIGVRPALRIGTR
jgi:formylglycine-generating enzyme required for sulfatase activity